VFGAIAIALVLATLAAFLAPLRIRRGGEEAGRARLGRFLALAFAGLTPVAAITLYFHVGAPHALNAPRMAPASPADRIAALPESERAAMIEGMVASLAARLEEFPGDPDGWRMLARSQAVLGDYAASARAWASLLALTDGDADDWRGYAQALIAAGPGDDRAAALEMALSRLHAIDPDDALALYYLGALAQASGDSDRAIVLWTRLLEVLPSDAPVRPAIEDLIVGAGSR
jgi:cytochrome c-type biogenesis protein CcmH